MKYPEIAAQIKKARFRKGWSQERAAREIGCSRIHWIRWEQGLHKPRGVYAKLLVELLGVPSELFEDDEDDRALRVGRAFLAMQGDLQV